MAVYFVWRNDSLGFVEINVAEKSKLRTSSDEDKESFLDTIGDNSKKIINWKVKIVAGRIVYEKQYNKNDQGFDEVGQRNESITNNRVLVNRAETIEQTWGDEEHLENKYNNKMKCKQRNFEEAANAEKKSVANTIPNDANN
jgi:hypothetical protein